MNGYEGMCMNWESFLRNGGLCRGGVECAMWEWGGSCRGGVDYVGVGWVGHVEVGWLLPFFPIYIQPFFE